MNQLIHHCLLLAARGRLDHLSSGFRRRTRLDSNDLVSGLMIIAGVAVAIWLLSLYMARQEKRPPCNKPLSLFWDLCKAHGLKLSDYWLLWRLARRQRLRDPARLFLEPERFNADKLGAEWKPHSERLRQLREKLFADLAAEKIEEPEATQPAAADPWSQPAPASSSPTA